MTAPTGLRHLLPIHVCALLFLSFQSLPAEALRRPQEEVAGKSPVLSINTPSSPLVDIGGSWQFHPGDNPEWASPEADDSDWAAISTEKGWDAQGYPDTGGFGWYRRHLHFTQSAMHPDLALMPLGVNSVAEVFWNGARIGSCGRLPPHERLVSCWAPIGVPLAGDARDGVLAIRVWAHPNYGLAPRGRSGFFKTPKVGTRQAVESAIQADLFHFWRDLRAQHLLMSLYAVACLLAFVAFAIDRREPFYLYLAVFLFTVAFRFLLDLWSAVGGLPWATDEDFLFTVGYLLQFSMLWLLLLRLFGLDKDRRWLLTTRIFILLTLLLCSVIIPTIHSLASWTGVTARVFRVSWGAFTLSELYTLVLIAAGIRRSSDRADWAVALSSTLAVTLPAVYNLLQLLQRWDIGDAIIYRPLFTILGGQVTCIEVAKFLLLSALGYAAVARLAQTHRQRVETELEMHSAQELQHVLIPDTLPEAPGFALASAYYPAREVGGDFFQVIPLASKSTLILLGDVSGKGLRAGMMVALIMGAARTAAEVDSDPSRVLASINRRLCGRMQGGFVTSIALLAQPDGKCVVANAGHLSPLLNGKEVLLPGALPLGLDPDAEYESEPLALEVGDMLTLYSDGIPEARNKGGELLGFERTATLAAEFKQAEAIARQARAFGQEDDITVLTIEHIESQRVPDAAKAVKG